MKFEIKHNEELNLDLTAIDKDGCEDYLGTFTRYQLISLQQCINEFLTKEK